MQGLFLAFHTKIQGFSFRFSMIQFRIYLFALLVTFSASIANAKKFVVDRTYTLAPPDTIPPNLDELEELTEEEDDSTAADLESFENINDEDICALINCDLYNAIWDTTRINPYGLNLKEKKDSTFLTLFHDVQCDYAHPTCGEITSEFGFRRTRYHYGIDINLETGDEVLAVFEGTVRVARFSPSYGYYVIVRHLNGLETLYAHLSQINVSAGKYIQAGDRLGLGGNTGHSRGSHLHFEVRFLGQQINPRDVISFEEYTCSTKELCISPANFDYLRKVEKHKAEVSKRKYHKIRKGDTLSKIARKHRTTVSKLCKLNRMSKKTKLRLGKRIRVA
jgi:murein DD-endopeptidase MepM/ murein hydrolase activator NlpD